MHTLILETVATSHSWRSCRKTRQKKCERQVLLPDSNRNVEGQGSKTVPGFFSFDYGLAFIFCLKDQKHTFAIYLSTNHLISLICPSCLPTWFLFSYEISEERKREGEKLYPQATQVWLASQSVTHESHCLIHLRSIIFNRSHLASQWLTDGAARFGRQCQHFDKYRGSQRHIETHTVSHGHVLQERDRRESTTVLLTASRISFVKMSGRTLWTKIVQATSISGKQRPPAEKIWIRDGIQNILAHFEWIWLQTSELRAKIVWRCRIRWRRTVPETITTFFDFSDIFIFDSAYVFYMPNTFRGPLWLIYHSVVQKFKVFRELEHFFRHDWWTRVIFERFSIS